MKCFYYSRYRFYNHSIKHALNFFLISDIHFSNKVNSTTLRAITEQASQKQPDYIIIAGDVIDSLDCIQSPSSLKRLTSWLEQLGKVAPVLIGLGNHDFYRKNPEHKSIFSSKRHWFPGTNIGYINAVNAIDNVQLLNNEAYEDDKVYIFGFTQAPEYFQFNRDEKHSSSIFRPGNEDLDIMLSDLDSLDQKLINNLPKHKAKIAIIHSPVFLTDSQVAAKLYEFDYFISGHMHNGVIPPIINDFWHSDRGFIAPGKKLFPRNARAKITNPSDKIITLGAVSTIQDSAKPITFMNGLFPINIATLELTKNELLARKPDIKHQYISL